MFYNIITAGDCVLHSSVYLVVLAPRLGHGHLDLGQILVNGGPQVVEGGRLQDDAGGADEDGQREDPQEEAVQHHRHVLPVLLHLREG